MALIKDGTVYRTYEEQVLHLTNAHTEQLTINKNVSKELQEISVSANLGGYNLVRFAFERQGIYYKLANALIDNPTGAGSEIGDYFEITSHNAEDIPAYGYLVEGNKIAISYPGDFMSQYSQLAVRNVTKGLEMYDTLQYVEFEGSYLGDYNPNERKKQLFNVLDDLAYGTRTQYASFDLNNDGIFNFVFVGTVQNGKNGNAIYVTNGVDVEEIVNKMTKGDYIQFAENNDTQLVNPEAVIGDVYIFEGNNTFKFVGNVRGEKGDTGSQGIQGEQGIQGVQGVQGIQGEKGDTGENGKDGITLYIHSEILNSPAELPELSTVPVAFAYRVINTSGTVVTYDLYFHAFDNDTEWAIQPNWGGVPGPKGDKGDKGEQGVQGIQGEQGEVGVGGKIYNHLISFKLNSNPNSQIYLNLITDFDDEINFYSLTDYLSLCGATKIALCMPCNGFSIDVSESLTEQRTFIGIYSVNSSRIGLKYLTNTFNKSTFVTSLSSSDISVASFSSFTDNVYQIN